MRNPPRRPGAPQGVGDKLRGSEQLAVPGGQAATEATWLQSRQGGPALEAPTSRAGTGALSSNKRVVNEI